MAEPQLSVRSERARNLAHTLARRENRTIADIVERALEAYASRELGRERAADFYARISSQFGGDIDLDAIIREQRGLHTGLDL